MNTLTTNIEDKRNIEIKAILTNEADFLKCIQIAEDLTASSSGEVLRQRDVFFKTQNGRLKLRYLLQLPQRSQLIYYERSDICGPKLAKYNLIEISEAEILEKILTATNGVEGIVIKERLLFIYQQRTRIHLDRVQNLGNFIEFEVCLLPGESLLEGEIIAQNLMKTFNIETTNLITGAYLDLLNKNSSQ